MHISTNYSTVYKPIWFIPNTQMCLHLLYILLICQVNISNSFYVINFFVFPTISEQLAEQPAMHFQGREGSNLPG